MTAAEVAQRAQSARGHDCTYRLGKGGFNPASPYPWNSHGECDCSGFAAWCLGFPRHVDHPWYVQMNGGWIETSQIVRDALSPFGFFEKIDWAQARLGDLIVYGDHDGHQGHVGVITDLDGDGPKMVTHCSLGNFRTFGDAIGESVPGLWKMHNGIIARAAGIT